MVVLEGNNIQEDIVLVAEHNYFTMFGVQRVVGTLEVKLHQVAIQKLKHVLPALEQDL